jgi:hypothetical protein
LTLLVARVGADDTHDAFALDDLAVAADLLYRCQYFHDALDYSLCYVGLSGCLLGPARAACPHRIVLRRFSAYFFTAISP